MLGLYIHVPFCKKICDYCDFRVISSNPKLFSEYSDLLCQEIEFFEKRRPGTLQTVETLYLGGGTPSILPVDQLRQIFDCLASMGVPLKKLREVSMEFNPESTTEESIQNARNLGVKRFSLGLQTFDGQMLQRIGRSHTVEAGKRAVQLLLEHPVEVSGDLMFNLPGQSLESFLGDVEELSSYPLNHISFYGLSVSPRTVLGQKVRRRELEINEDLYEEMYLGGVEILEKKGFARYEVSNFAKPGFESVHNRNYWERGEYIGFGPGAHSFVNNTRFYAPEMYPRWREYVRAGAKESDLTSEVLNEDDLLMELIWLSMRQSGGLSLCDVRQMGYTLKEKIVRKWEEHGYVEVLPSETGAQRIRLKGRGWIFMDDVVTDFANNCCKKK